MTNRGRAALSAASESLRQGRLVEAAALAREALRELPESAEPLQLLGVATARMGDLVAAAQFLQRAVAAEPRALQAWWNLAITQEKLGQAVSAADSYRRCIALDPRFASGHIGLGNMLMAKRRYAEAADSLAAALDLQPSDLKTASTLACIRRIMCDWKDGGALEARLIEAVAAGHDGVVPFHFLAMTDDPVLQLACARMHGANLTAVARPRVARRDGRIRLGYLSADFRDHATSFLMAELFELHDRAAFEVVAFSYGPSENSPMRRRIEHAFDRFEDVSAETDAAISDKIAAAGIDIAIDLKGLIQGGRLGILATRPAPIQVHYLGYPGTLGVDCVDYLLADRFVVPSERTDSFAEKIVHLPGSYQINDRRRPAVSRAPKRADYGLPEGAFVFCSFNASYKITSTVFDIWARLLKAVPGSLLWVFADDRWAVENLRREAAARGLGAERLVFAEPAPYADHLARHALADLFLDTLPVNAHTTASDALWAGLPVVTCAGRSFAARVAGSLLHAVGLPELVAENLADYESLACRLATDRQELAGLRHKLANARSSASLFDAERTTRSIETAYRRMWDIHCRGEPPRSFAVEG